MTDHKSVERERVERVELRLLDSDGHVLVAVCAPRPEAEREIAHYAMMYRDEGPCRIVEFKRKGQQ